MHVAVIMDGNGRWAARRGRPRWVGHVQGARTVRRLVEYGARQGVTDLTLYAFSCDNWKRPAEEVSMLFDLFRTQLARQLRSLIANGIRLSVVGRRDRIPAALVEAIVDAEARTAGGRRMHLRLAVDYSSRDAIAQAWGPRAPSGDAAPSPLLPAVDLLVRTGGERRLSDFLLWESAYAELVFVDVAFPDLSVADLDRIFAEFAGRDRRFGGLTQVVPA